MEHHREHHNSVEHLREVGYSRHYLADLHLARLHLKTADENYGDDRDIHDHHERGLEDSYHLLHAQVCLHEVFVRLAEALRLAVFAHIRLYDARAADVFLHYGIYRVEPRCDYAVKRVSLAHNEHNYKYLDRHSDNDNNAELYVERQHHYDTADE